MVALSFVICVDGTTYVAEQKVITMALNNGCSPER